MNILVFGAGALGAYFGGRLQEVGVNVQFLVRPRRAQQLRENGLVLHSSKGDYQVQPLNIVEDVAEIDNVDLVLLAVKGYHLQGTLPQLKALVQKGAKVLPVLNGVEHLKILQKELGEEAVIGGFIYIFATLDKKGHVIHSGDTHTIKFGALHPSQQAICDEFLANSQNANMKVMKSEHILQEMWDKYMFITALSGITTAGNFPIGVVRKHPATYHIMKQVLAEMKTLANAHGIELTNEHIEKAVHTIEKLNEDATSSMHQDRRKGLTLEVEHLQGGALRLAEEVNLKLPYIETLYGLIKPFENA